MKKFLLLALILVTTTFIGGCSSQPAEQPAPAEKVSSILLKESFWVVDSGNIPYLNDAITRKDTEYIKQLMIEGKVFLVDRDTKVTQIGEMTAYNNVPILFNEGRYTNKKGFTHASNVVAEKDFPAYVETQKQKNIALIKVSLANTEKYTDVIATGNIEEIKHLSKECLDQTNELKRFRQGAEKDVLEQSEMAIEIIFERDFALGAYEHLIEYSAKVEQENSSTKTSRVYSNMRQNFRNDVDRHIQKAEQLRQEFRNKYGY